jgi:hypothetical protein
MATSKEPQNAIGWTRRLNGPLAAAGVGVDAYMRIREGEAVPIAVGKAVVSNALWAMAPGGMVGAIALNAGIIAMQSAPIVMNALDQKRAALNQKRSQFGGTFQSTQAQQLMLNHSVNQIMNARSQLASSMANHARQAQRVY